MAGSWTYHPFELAVCGMSTSGKTTLIERLICSIKERFAVGYAKHGANAMDLDRSGKDTFRAARAGAATVVIETEGAYALLGGSGPLSPLDRARLMLDCDMVLIEGMKYAPVPKLVVLDAGGEALRQVESGAITNVVAFVGGQPATDVLAGRPCFDRDQIERIAQFVEAHMRSAAKAPLFGLVLAGGYSERMGSEKWAMEFVPGETQLERTSELLSGVCREVHVSVRPGQDVPDLKGAARIVDSFPFGGPLVGLLSAMYAHPEAAWLVAACDLPLLDTRTATDLVERRNPLRLATAYESNHDQLPEPLFAIWEPRSRHRILEALALDLRCPRRILIQSRTELLTLPVPHALDNANTPEQAELMRGMLRRGQN